MRGSIIAALLMCGCSTTFTEAPGPGSSGAGADGGGGTSASAPGGGGDDAVGGGSTGGSGGAGGAATSSGIGGAGGAASFGPCDAGAHQHPVTGHCYQYIETEMDWDEAYNWCTNLGLGYDLAALTSFEEIAYVDDTINPTQNVLIGGNDKATEGTWVWTNMEPWFDDAWRPGEPSNSMPGQHCLALQDQSGPDRFDDKGCFINHHVLCERDAP